MGASVLSKVRVMAQPLQSSVRNGLLAAMSAKDFALLQSDLESVPLAIRDVLVEPNKSIKYVHFIEHGLASVIAENPGHENVEIAHVGCEGLTGMPLIHGVDRTPNKTFIQVAGSAFRLRADDLRQAMEDSPSLRALLLRFVHTMLIQVSHSALANGRYSIHERLARWLLMCHDRMEGDDLPLTHDFVSLMLGVRRAGVTEALHVLESGGMIDMSRGGIVVRDRTKLEEATNGCYGLPEAEYARLIGKAKGADTINRIQHDFPLAPATAGTQHKKLKA
jgi:CRP-like cAMP-binding protein